MWSDNLNQYLKAVLGDEIRIESVNGKSGASVYRVRGEHASRIVKNSAKEVYFYQHIAPILRANAIPLPDSDSFFGESWVVLEDIPLKAEAGDGRMVAILARLHTIDADIPLENPYVPTWTDELTEKALACFSPEIAARFRPRLADLRGQAQPLFQPEAYISGDPNPANWGARQDGTLVLFDWERFTRAAPEIDLAIIVAGLGDRAQFLSTAQAYLDVREEIGRPYAISAQELAESMALAKLWTVVEFLSNYTDGLLQPDATLDYIRRELGAWVGSLF